MGEEKDFLRTLLLLIENAKSEQSHYAPTPFFSYGTTLYNQKAPKIHGIFLAEMISLAGKTLVNLLPRRTSW